MYFDNIANEELQYFHGLKVPNFTIKLTEVLHQTGNEFDNKLFKIEEIISDKLYRIYPMFYTGKITSSNPEDKIIDDKLIIVNKTTSTTYLTFISDETQEIQDYTSYGTYYSIGDTLTTAQYNSIISLIRRNMTHTDQLQVTDEFIGMYGKYEFDIEDCTFMDNGILITSETIAAEPKVKLTGNVFKNSTYLLKLSVLHYSDVNIIDGVTPSDFKVIETLEVTLTPNRWVDIPVGSLYYGYIILYDAIVEISHDKPVIVGIGVIDFTLSTNKSTINIGETCTLTVYLSEDNIPMAGESVVFKQGSTVLDTVLTDNEGSATYNYTGTGAGVIVFSAEAVSMSRSVTISDGGSPTPVVPASISLTSDKSILSYYDSETAVLTATVLDDEDNPLSGQSVTMGVYQGSTLVESLTVTDVGDGTYTAGYNSKGAGDLSIHCECMNLQETYELEDCIMYRETLPIQGDNVVNIGLPSSFEIDFTIYSTNPTTDPSIAFFRFNNSSGGWIGKGASTSRNVSLFGTVFNTIDNTYTDYNYVFTYQNGVATLTDGLTTKTSAQSLTKLYQATSRGGSQLKNIKVKPL